MKKILILSLLIFVSNSPFIAQTNVSGFISSNTTWQISGSPYIVTGSIIVDPGVTLTIQPGVVVKFNGGLALRIDGTLAASGTSSSRIIFTANTNTPVPGSWAYIMFTNSSADASFDAGGNYISGCILKYCDIFYGGSILDKGAIYADNSSPYISNCSVSYSLNSGIYLYNSTSRTENNFILGNGKAGIFYNSSPYNPVVSIFIRNNNILNNSGEGIKVFNASSDTVNIIGNTVQNNHGEGGIVFGSLIQWEDGGLYVKIIGNSLQNNSSTKIGGITCFRPRFMEIRNNIVTQNTGTDIGGIYTHMAFNPTTLILSNNTINSNTGGKYGACYLNFFSGGYNSTAAVTGNTICYNYTTGANYGAIKLEGDQSYNNITFNFNNNVVRKNSAAKTIVLTHGKGFLNLNNLDSNFSVYDLYSENASSAPPFNARRNFWGTTNINIINQRVYDFFDDPSRGVILVDSFAVIPYPIGIKKTGDIIPLKFSLSQNYPNPFNPLTTIKFDMPETKISSGNRSGISVKLAVYDVLGREIAVLVNNRLIPGSYVIIWNAAGFPSGIYFYSLTSDSFNETKKMILLK